MKGPCIGPWLCPCVKQAPVASVSKCLCITSTGSVSYCLMLCLITSYQVIKTYLPSYQVTKQFFNNNLQYILCSFALSGCCFCLY